MARQTRRGIVLACTAALLLGACTEVRKNSAFWSTVTNNRPQKSDADIRTYADSLPYTSMLFWFDGQSRALIILGSDDPAGKRTWYTAEKQTVDTFGPFVVGATGNDVELLRTEFEPGWSTDVRQLVGKTLIRRTIVAQRGNEATATLRSTFRNAGPATVKVLGTDVAAYRIDETVVANNRVRLLNSYWLAPDTGAVLKTRQQVIPTMPPVTTITLKP